MRPIRTLATALLVASLAVTGCGRSQPEETGPPADQPPPHRSPSPLPPPPAGGTDRPVILADGRHTVYLKTVDPNRRTIAFDLIQFYGKDEALRKATKDHPEASPEQVRQWVPNDFYIRNVNPKLRTLPVRSDAAITVITLAWAKDPPTPRGSSRCLMPTRGLRARRLPAILDHGSARPVGEARRAVGSVATDCGCWSGRQPQSQASPAVPSPDQGSSLWGADRRSEDSNSIRTTRRADSHRRTPRGRLQGPPGLSSARKLPPSRPRTCATCGQHSARALVVRDYLE
jgi:hypothetical protein